MIPGLLSSTKALAFGQSLLCQVRLDSLTDIRISSISAFDQILPPCQRSRTLSCHVAVHIGTTLCILEWSGKVLNVDSSSLDFVLTRLHDVCGCPSCPDWSFLGHYLIYCAHEMSLILAFLVWSNSLIIIYFVWFLGHKTAIEIKRSKTVAFMTKLVYRSLWSPLTWICCCDKGLAGNLLRCYLV